MATDKSLLWKLAHALQAQKGYPIGKAVKDAKILLESDKNQARELIKANEQRIKAAMEAEKAAKKAAREAIAAEKKAEKQRIKAAMEAEKAEKKAAINQKKAEVKQANEAVQAARKGKKLLKPKRGSNLTWQDIIHKSINSNTPSSKVKTLRFAAFGKMYHINSYDIIKITALINNKNKSGGFYIKIQEKTFRNRKQKEGFDNFLMKKDDSGGYSFLDVDRFNDFLEPHGVYIRKPTFEDRKKVGGSIPDVYRENNEILYAVMPVSETGKKYKSESYINPESENKLENRFQKMLEDSEKNMKQSKGGNYIYYFNSTSGEKELTKAKHSRDYWGALITGPDPQYKLKREFITVKEKAGDGVYIYMEMKPGKYYQIKDGSKIQFYAKIVGGELVKVEESEVIQSFK